MIEQPYALKTTLDSGQNLFAAIAPECVAAATNLTPIPTARVFAVTSGKGGVGKTNTVVNLAAALARKKKKVLVMDADLGLANVDLFLGVKPKYTLADFFSGQKRLADIIISTPSGIFLLPAASGIQEVTALSDAQKIAFITELDALTHDLDLVLVDTSSGISDTVTYFTTAAQEIIVVVTPDVSSMTDAYALLKVLASEHDEKRFWVLANNVDGEISARRLYDTLSRTALRFLNTSLDFLGWVPWDPALRRAVFSGQIVSANSADSPSARAFSAIAERLLEQAGEEIRLKGNLQFFFRRVLGQRRSR
ncbi:MAG TPA: MinD/ParA family protein [Verrucomicrobiae bacterium]|jgi:flagellar biosynthesis protein FlhG|nr:MinD/ParA family protein [Verrucomicrobiae bacterium]